MLHGQLPIHPRPLHCLLHHQSRCHLHNSVCFEVCLSVEQVGEGATEIFGDLC